VGVVLVLPFILLTAGITTAGYFSYRSYESHFGVEIEHQLSAVAELKVNELVRWRRARLADGSVLLGNSAFSGLVRRWFEAPGDSDARAQITEWLGKLQATDQYDQIILLDARGVRRLSIPETREPPAAHPSRDVVEVLRSGRVGFLDFHRDAPSEPVHLAALVPILVGADHPRPLGVLVLRIDPEQYLYPFLHRWPIASRTAETLLVRRDGNDVLFLNELRFQKDTALTLRQPLIHTNLAAVKAALGQEGVEEGVDYRGAPVLAAVRAVPDSPWSLVARMDTSEVYAPLRERRWMMVALVFVTLLAAGTGVGFVWRQQELRSARERYRAAEALNQSEARFQQFAESAPIGMSQADPRTGRWLSVNRKMCAITGYSESELLGLRVPDITHPEDREADWEAFERVVRGETPSYRIEKRYLRKDGGETWVNVNMTVLRDAAGQPVRTMAVIEDISERRRAEEALRGSEERLRRAVVDSPFPLLLHAEDGAVLQVSNSWCEVTGYTREELATIDDWTERAYGDRKKRVQADIEALYGLERRKAEGDYSIRIKDGTTRIWEFSSAPLGRLPDGRRLVLSMAMDVTERRTAESEVQRLNAELEQRVVERTQGLEVANQELEAFSYSVSHDLRAPLRHIDGFVGLLLERCRGELTDQGRHYLDTVADSARQMGRLIDELLQFSRTGRAEMHEAGVDMNKTVREAVNSLANELAGRTIEWVIGDLPPVRGDGAMLRLVWTNLLGNAIKYTRAKDRARIEVAAREGPDETTFVVRDDGVGFDMRYAHKLFGVFQRLHSEAEFEGTGIGLATVRRIVSRHGGRTWAEAELGAGAAFYFSLPRSGGEDDGQGETHPVGGRQSEGRRADPRRPGRLQPGQPGDRRPGRRRGAGVPPARGRVPVPHGRQPGGGDPRHQDAAHGRPGSAAGHPRRPGPEGDAHRDADLLAGGAGRDPELRVGDQRLRGEAGEVHRVRRRGKAHRGPVGHSQRAASGEGCP
jgi:PAS domain S-box-containing protein